MFIKPNQSSQSSVQHIIEVSEKDNMSLTSTAIIPHKFNFGDISWIFLTHARTERVNFKKVRLFFKNLGNLFSQKKPSQTA